MVLARCALSRADTSDSLLPRSTPSETTTIALRPVCFFMSSFDAR